MPFGGMAILRRGVTGVADVQEHVGFDAGLHITSRAVICKTKTFPHLWMGEGDVPLHYHDLRSLDKTRRAVSGRKGLQWQRPRPSPQPWHRVHLHGLSRSRLIAKIVVALKPCQSSL